MTTGRTMVETVTLCVCGAGEGGSGIDRHNSDDVNGLLESLWTHSLSTSYEHCRGSCCCR